MEKRSVKLKAVLISLVRYWYIVLVFVLAGAFVAWKITVNYNNDVDQKIKEAAAREEGQETGDNEKKTPEMITVTKKDCVKKLTNAQEKTVEDTYANYLKLQDKKRLYGDNLWYSLDPFNETIVYYNYKVVIEGEDVPHASVRSFIHSVKNYVSFGALVNDIKAKTDLGNYIMTISDLIVFSDGGSTFDDDLFTVYVYQSPELGNASEVIRDSILAYGEKLSTDYPGLSLILKDTITSTGYDSKLYSSIESMNKTLTSLQNTVDNAVKKLSKYQLAYYTLLVEDLTETEIEADEEVVDVKIENTETAEEVIPEKRSLRTYTALGGAAGLVLSFIVFLFLGLLSGHVLSLNDFYSIYGISGLGSLLQREKKMIPGVLQKLEYPEAEKADDAAFLYLTLRQACVNNDLKEAVVVSTREVSRLSGIQTICERAKKDGIVLHFVDNFPSNIDGADDIVQAGGVILAETMHRSRLKNVDRVVDFCNKNEIKIFGAIGIVA